MKITKVQWISMIVAIVFIILDFVFLLNDKLFYFVMGISLIFGSAPFMISIVLRGGEEKVKEEMFLEFARNLAESVRAGTPISKSILNVKNKNYESLTPYIHKLANQISLGIPVREALAVFARDVDNKTVSRAISLISEAERAGGDIELILEAVANSVSLIEQLKKEKTAAIYNLVVQGYIIFMIFIVIMLIMEYKILPMTAGITSYGLGGGGVNAFTSGITSGLSQSTAAATQLNVKDFERPFMFLLIVQGVFAGLTIGKIAEGKIKYGIKHSFILTTLAVLIATGARVVLG
jgi:flagellar protein FlaJ